MYAWYGIQKRLITSIDLGGAQLEQNYCKSYFLHGLQSTAFQLGAAKQKAWQQYQLYMQEANKGIYFTTNSLI